MFVFLGIEMLSYFAGGPGMVPPFAFCAKLHATGAHHFAMRGSRQEDTCL